MEKLEFSDKSVNVELVYDTEANGPRLRVEDRSSGEISFLDPLELECLTRVPEGKLSEYLSNDAAN